MRYYFAPLEGVTGCVYRSAHHRYFPGVDRYYMPFLSPTQNRVFTPRMRQDIDPARNLGVPVVPQLLTKCAEDFIWAARNLADMGYTQVNLNLGCPSGTVAAKGKGSGFLARPAELAQFLDAIFAAAPLPISVKTRLGLTDPAEFAPLLELYNQYPITELTIHPRVQKDMYRNTPRMDVFTWAAAHSKNPVCYNGDLVTKADCAAFAAGNPCVEAVMIGRGLVANPALLGQVLRGQGADAVTLRAFHDEVYRGYCDLFASERNAMLRMKEIWFYMHNLFDGSEAHFKRLRKAEHPRAFEAAADAIFRELPLCPDVTGCLHA